MAGSSSLSTLVDVAKPFPRPPAAPRQGPRACDRCFLVKERCSYSSSSTECDRCIRLCHSCARTRPVQKPGRKPQAKTLKNAAAGAVVTSHSTNTQDGGSSPQSALLHPVIDQSPDPFGPIVEGLKPLEELALRRMLDKAWFSEYMVLGPHFVDEMQRELATYILSAFDLVKDGYIACYGAFATAMGFELGGFDRRENLARGALAVRKLRAATEPDMSEVTPWICLGLAIVTFAQCALGTDASPVRRHVLNYVRPLHDLSSELRTNSMLVCLIVLDINECLVRRKTPAIRPRLPDTGRTDRYMGVCLPLLPLMYNICELSDALHHADESDIQSILVALEDTQRAVQDWQPEIPHDFVHNFTTTEVTHILTQSRVYKMANLLFIHRLKCSFNVGDDLASLMASTIISDLDLARKTTGRPPRYVTLPFLLAAIEANHVAEREMTLKYVDYYVDNTSPNIRANVKAFLRSLWKIRDDSSGISWLDLVDQLPRVSICI